MITQNMVAWCNLVEAIELVNRAVEEDNKRNYAEALRFYEHGIEYFLYAILYEAEGDKGKDIIRIKCMEYLERAYDLKEYLNNEKEDYDTTSNVNSLENAVDLVTKAVQEDYNHNYEEALRFYEDGVKVFLHVLKYQPMGDKAKNSVRAKCILYLERAQQIKICFKENKHEPITKTKDSEYAQISLLDCIRCTIL